MGVISVGASLGVRGGAAREPAQLQPAPPPAALSQSQSQGQGQGRRARSSIPAEGAGFGRRKQPRKRPSGAPPAPSGPSGASTAISSARASAKGKGKARREDEEGEAAAGSRVRVVDVRTRVAPRVLAPLVLGPAGGKLGAVMARSQCSIIYHAPERQAGSGQDGRYTMSFTVSADSGGKVDEGVQLLQAVVESSEQKLRRRPSEGSADEQGGEAFESAGSNDEQIREEAQEQQGLDGEADRRDDRQDTGARYRQEAASDQHIPDERHAQTRIPRANDSSVLEPQRPTTVDGAVAPTLHRKRT